jgi:hypothetical protein
VNSLLFVLAHVLWAMLLVRIRVQGAEVGAALLLEEEISHHRQGEGQRKNNNSSPKSLR